MECEGGSTFQQIVRMLLKGRIDFALFGELAGWALIANGTYHEILRRNAIPPDFAVSEEPRSAEPGK